MRWLRRLFGVHEHQWEPVSMHYLVNPGSQKPYGVRHILRCKHCGDVTKRDV